MIAKQFGKLFAKYGYKLRVGGDPDQRFELYITRYLGKAYTKTLLVAFDIQGDYVQFSHAVSTQLGSSIHSTGFQYVDAISLALPDAIDRLDDLALDRVMAFDAQIRSPEPPATLQPIQQPPLQPPPPTPAPKPRAVIVKRTTKTQDALARWQRKLKLASNKVKKLKARTAYYAKRTGDTT